MGGIRRSGSEKGENKAAGEVRRSTVIIAGLEGSEAPAPGVGGGVRGVGVGGGREDGRGVAVAWSVRAVNSAGRKGNIYGAGDLDTVSRDGFQVCQELAEQCLKT